MKSPQVNGHYRYNGTHNQKPLYRHVTENINIHSDSRNSGNWHFGDDIEKGKVFYWSFVSDELSMIDTWYIADTPLDEPIVPSAMSVDFTSAGQYDVLYSVHCTPLHHRKINLGKS